MPQQSYEEETESIAKEAFSIRMKSLVDWIGSLDGSTRRGPILDAYCQVEAAMIAALVEVIAPGDVPVQKRLGQRVVEQLGKLVDGVIDEQDKLH